jgi:hypothetical protein
VVGEGADGILDSDFLPSSGASGADERAGVFARKSTGGPEARGSVPERLQAFSMPMEQER